MSTQGNFDSGGRLESKCRSSARTVIKLALSGSVDMACPRCSGKLSNMMPWVYQCDDPKPSDSPSPLSEPLSDETRHFSAILQLTATFSASHLVSRRLDSLAHAPFCLFCSIHTCCIYLHFLTFLTCIFGPPRGTMLITCY